MKIRGRSLVVCLGLLCLSAARGQQYTIQTLAGIGTAGFAGDSGAPLLAQFSSPSAGALGASGNLYIADTVNHCIRKISGNIITTIPPSANPARPDPQPARPPRPPPPRPRAGGGGVVGWGGGVIGGGGNSSNRRL